jgi:formylglycine-generating enzyme required for sulfatase activity
LSHATGREYRLPSEAEWEYACRAGTTTPFHFGETITTDLANYDGNSTYANAPKGKYRQQTTDVGSFLPNGFGLYDMHGNVWEWCADDWHIWLNSDKSNTTKVLRGGSWYYYPWICRSAVRYYYSPAIDINFGLGFRIVCVSPRTS